MFFQSSDMKTALSVKVFQCLSESKSCCNVKRYYLKCFKWFMCIFTFVSQNKSGSYKSL